MVNKDFIRRRGENILRRKPVAALLVLIAAFALAGCLDISTTIRVKPDGSGTLTEQFIVDRSLADMTRDAQGGAKEKEKPYGLFTEEELVKRAAQFGDGVRLLSVKPYSEKTRTGFTATYSFTDLSKVNIGMNPETNFNAKALDFIAQAKTRKEAKPIRFAFDNGKINVLMPVSNFVDSLPEFRNPALEAVADGTFGAEFVKQLAKMFSMKLKVSLIAEGKVVSSNAPFRKGNEFTLFALDFGELMQDTASLRAVSKAQPKTLNDVKKQLTTMKGIMLPLEEQFTIQLKK